MYKVASNAPPVLVESYDPPPPPPFEPVFTPPPFPPEYPPPPPPLFQLPPPPPKPPSAKLLVVPVPSPPALPFKNDLPPYVTFVNNEPLDEPVVTPWPPSPKKPKPLYLEK